MMLDDIKTYLVAQGITTTIKKAQMSNDPDECICLYQYAGQGELNEAQCERAGLQVKSRANDYSTAMTNIQAVAAILRAVGNEINGTTFITESGTNYYRILPVQSAFDLGLDDNQRTEIVQNFYVTKEY